MDIQFVHRICDPLFRSEQGLTVAELLLQVEGYSLESLQTAVDLLEQKKFVHHEMFDGRGKVYRPLVFETIEDLRKAKTIAPNSP